MYVDSLSCVRVNGGEKEQFRIDSGVRQGCTMSPWLFNIYMDGVMKEGKHGDGKDRSEIPGIWERLKITLPLVWFCILNQRRT